ncbi:MAG: serine/threonine-protein phosphatase [Clostridia bacterium]|nr:serine/threonine-protein phosphatase [Clostridia bacterium]
MNFFGKSDVGTRDNNEDCFGIYEIGENAALFVVCDGMGGESSGEIASRLALESFSETVLSICRLHLKQNRLSLSLREAELILSNAAEHANGIVLDYQQKHPESAGMGTTLIATIVCDGNTVAWLNLGDSRLYTVDKRDILQVSKDHSYIQYMIDTGELTLEQAKTSPVRNLITRAVGIEKDISPDVDLFELSDAERSETSLVLCSDGLSGALPEEECMGIANRRDISPAEKVELMIEGAKKHGSTDNITLILVELW